MPPLTSKIRRLKVSVSLRCFESWLASLQGLTGLRASLPGIAKLVDGFEVQFSHADILNAGRDSAEWIPGWLSHLSSDSFDYVRASSSNVGHLENLHHLSPRTMSAFIRGLRRLASTTGIRNFTVHPVGVPVGAWKSLRTELGPDVRLCVENMSPKAGGFADLDEMAALLDAVPALFVTLDICHLAQSGRALDEAAVLNFVDTYRERIAVTHLSVPAADRTELGSSHALCSGKLDGSISNLLLSLSSESVLVIEGACPPLRDALIIDEIMTFRLLSTGAQLAA